MSQKLLTRQDPIRLAVETQVRRQLSADEFLMLVQVVEKFLEQKRRSVARWGCTAHLATFTILNQEEQEEEEGDQH
jgi:hypothetical protein